MLYLKNLFYILLLTTLPIKFLIHMIDNDQEEKRVKFAIEQELNKKRELYKSPSFLFKNGIESSKYAPQYNPNHGVCYSNEVLLENGTSFDLHVSEEYVHGVFKKYKKVELKIYFEFTEDTAKVKRSLDKVLSNLTDYLTPDQKRRILNRSHEYMYYRLFVSDILLESTELCLAEYITNNELSLKSYPCIDVETLYEKKKYRKEIKINDFVKVDILVWYESDNKFKVYIDTYSSDYEHSEQAEYYANYYRHHLSRHIHSKVWYDLRHAVYNAQYYVKSTVSENLRDVDLKRF
ncbi:hypothetical protein [Flammeovirga kamogawensis]|uniref:Uncharacterized protein n=1 Tax=Flammeovirga kamogawensis TaxID=373891 RepID=A0ABX8H445_9BACT|nr:hypothetical protein [Flammeovirga kamogawensis]MBB6463516.1 hypothetical protein [Flammeovirga kamogawensis]QWG10575.1 hypothetical protein KM029_24640 [Flammeovirga kamogawensis]TRX63681.1 hypothetical protein EO216_25025 [Flammeovirga kamogawensis]